MKKILAKYLGRIIALTAGFMALPVFAHERWFTEESIMHSSKPIIFSELTAFGVSVTGLAIMFRIFLRPVALLGIFVFSASIFVFGFTELLGHLPIKVALFLIFIHGPYLEQEKS